MPKLANFLVIRFILAYNTIGLASQPAFYKPQSLTANAALSADLEPQAFGHCLLVWLCDLRSILA